MSGKYVGKGGNRPVSVSELASGGVSVQQPDKEERPYGGMSNGGHVPGKVVGWELQAETSCKLNSRPNKHHRRLLAWNYRNGFHLEL
eukprot:5885626-Heterocapsa_arctica.AAC.1